MIKLFPVQKAWASCTVTREPRKIHIIINIVMLSFIEHLCATSLTRNLQRNSSERCLQTRPWRARRFSPHTQSHSWKERYFWGFNQGTPPLLSFFNLICISWAQIIDEHLCFISIHFWESYLLKQFTATKRSTSRWSGVRSNDLPLPSDCKVTQIDLCEQLSKYSVYFTECLLSIKLCGKLNL